MNDNPAYVNWLLVLIRCCKQLCWINFIVRAVVVKPNFISYKTSPNHILNNSLY